MKNFNRLLAIVLLFVIPMGFTPHKKSTVDFETKAIQTCLTQIKQLPKIIVPYDDCSSPTDTSYIVEFIFSYQEYITEYITEFCSEVFKQLEYADFRYKKIQRYNQDTCGILVDIRAEIDAIDLINVRKIYNKIDAIDSVLAYFPKVDTTTKGSVKQLKGLIAIVRLDAIWRYLEHKYKIPREVSISFWIHETGYGLSNLFRKHKNFGGIKYHKSLRIPFETYPVWRFDDCYNDKGEKIKCPFLGYHKLSVAINSWGKVLALSRYTNHYNVTDDYVTMIDAYHSHGYWTSKNGGKHRIQTIETYDLHMI